MSFWDCVLGLGSFSILRICFDSGGRHLGLDSGVSLDGNKLFVEVWGMEFLTVRYVNDSGG